MFVRDDFKGSQREDDLLKAGLTLYYALSRRWTIRGGVEYTTRDADSVSGFDYDSNIVFAGLDIRL